MERPGSICSRFALRADAVNAIDFLDAVRCYLHYRQGRDLNVLTYEMQSEAAAKGIGLHGGRAASAERLDARLFSPGARHLPADGSV